MLGGVDVCGLYLVGLGSYHISVHRTFVFDKDISRFVHISYSYVSVYHGVVFYIAFVVLGVDSPDDTMYLILEQRV